MRENASKNNDKKQYYTMMAVAIGIVILIVNAIVVFAFAPRLKAEKIKKDILSDISDIMDHDVLQTVVVSDMRADDPLFGAENGEITIKNKSEIEKLVAFLYKALETADYENSVSGNLGGWDIRIRLYFDKGFKEIYSAEGKLYFFAHGTRCIFSTPDTELYKYVLELVSKKDADIPLVN